MKTIGFRIDAGSTLGTGHAARCSILAEACRKRGWRIVWFTSSPELEKFVSGRIVRLSRKLSTAQQAREISAKLPVGSVIVLDGYHLKQDLEKKLRLCRLKVVTIDDNAERTFSADLVMNGNVHARKLRYRRDSHTRVALGPDYFLLSEDVRTSRKPRAFSSPVKRIFVTMGGADPFNQALKVLKAVELVKHRGISVAAVAGAANRRFTQLRRFGARASYQCRVVRTTPRIGPLMAAADVGISSAGRVAAEMAYLGVPSLKIVVADNQQGLVRELHKRGAAINLGWHHRLSPKSIARALRRLMDDVALRRKMSNKGKALFDGKGTERVMKILESMAK